MSDTPLTDAEMCDGWSGDAFAVSVEFARKLEKQNKILMLKANASLANNLCPDHRDKQNGKPCLACKIERIEKQLAERDAALARFSAVLSSVANAVEKEAFRMEAPNEHTPIFVGIANFARNNNCGLPASAQATAKVRNDALERAAQIVEGRGKEIGGAIDPKRTAAAIREEQDK